MSLIQQLNVACSKELDRVTNMVYADMTGAVAPHSRSGEALGSIHIETTSEFSRFVGGASDHLYYLNYGRGEVRPVRRQVLRYTDGSFHPYSSPYQGIHFIESIASKYR